MRPALTKTGSRKLSDVARHLVVPGGIVTTGYPAVRDKCRDLGIVHDDWQQGLGRLILGKRADGRYAATVGGVGLSIPRQVGKTFTIGSILFALCILFPRLLVLWTAHRTRTANETFRVMKGMAQRTRIKPFVKAVRAVNGEQEIEFHNGSRILFGARERGFGRGFAEVDVEAFDEAQILTDRALEDMIPATNQARHAAGALLFFMGTPPRPTDPGEAFTRMRDEALSGEAEDVVWVELSADDGADPGDWEQIAKANPSFPERTPREAVLRMRKRLGDESFIREGMGLWDAGAAKRLDPASWSKASDSGSKVAGPVALGLSVAPWQTKAAVAGGGRRDDGRGHGELVEHRPGTGWVVPRLVELAKAHGPCVLTLNPRTESGALIKALNEAGFVTEPGDGQWRLQLLGASEYAQACGGLTADVRNDRWRHLGQGPLDAAVEGAGTRKLADSWAWSWKDSSVDISPLEAVTCARHGFASYGLEPELSPFVMVGK